MVSLYTDLSRKHPSVMLFKPLSRIYSPIEAFVTYDGKRAKDIPPPRFMTRQVISNEVRSTNLIPKRILECLHPD